MDVPNARSSHAVSVPRSGGVAVAAAAAAGLLVALPHAGSQRVVVLLLALALAGVGLLDDWHGLDPLPRLVAQLVAGIVAGIALGGDWAILAGAILLPVVVNIVNFMDGINGITSLNVSVWAGAALGVGLLGGDRLLAVVGAVSLGGAVGFLPFNVPSARLFLGDAGSYLFGGLIGMGVLRGLTADHHLHLLLAPLALYASDVAATLIRRGARGESLTSPHREHGYQLLVSDLGWPHPAVAALTASLGAFITVCWVILSWPFATSVTVLLCAGYLALPHVLRHSRFSVGTGAKRPPERPNSPTERTSR
nr:hypothetical protein [Segeticoccus rhizosphaerae]